MKSKWINKRFNIKHRIKTNKAIIIMIIFYLLIGTTLLIISKINSSNDGFCYTLGIILIFLSIFMIIGFIFSCFTLTKNKVFKNLKKQNISQNDLVLFDKEMNSNYKSEIYITAASITITNNFLVKDYTMANKALMYKITNLNKIIYTNDSFNALPGKAAPSEINTGTIKFYDFNGTLLFCLYELRLDSLKIIRYFKDNKKDIIIEENEQ